MKPVTFVLMLSVALVALACDPGSAPYVGHYTGANDVLLEDGGTQKVPFDANVVKTEDHGFSVGGVVVGAEALPTFTFRIAPLDDASDDRDAIGLVASPMIVGPSARRGRDPVIVVSLDTLRADHLPSYGYARETAPRPFRSCS